MLLFCAQLCCVEFSCVELCCVGFSCVVLSCVYSRTCYVKCCPFPRGFSDAARGSVRQKNLHAGYGAFLSSQVQRCVSCTVPDIHTHQCLREELHRLTLPVTHLHTHTHTHSSRFTVLTETMLPTACAQHQIIRIRRYKCKIERRLK